MHLDILYSGAKVREWIPWEKVEKGSNFPNSKQRYFSISTEYVREYSEIGNPIIKGKINGYSNLKSDIKYYVYVFDKDKELNPSDITKGEIITINPDGTFKYEYSDSQITQYPGNYKFVVGFNYEGITYYGPILDLKYDGLCPDNNHPHAIDLGLPSGTKWACCNVDTKHPQYQSPTNYGGYYAWGETKEKSFYTYSTYQYWKDTNDDGWIDLNEITNLGSDIAGTVYDVAHVKWGGSWVMPSSNQIQELLDNTTSTWVTLNGNNGRLFSGSNGGNIFFLAQGYCFRDSVYDDCCDGCYWSSTVDSTYEKHAYYLGFVELWAGLINNNGVRSYGYSVRPVSR